MAASQAEDTRVEGSKTEIGSSKAEDTQREQQLIEDRQHEESTRLALASSNLPAYNLQSYDISSTQQSPFAKGNSVTDQPSQRALHEVEQTIVAEAALHTVGLSQASLSNAEMVKTAGSENISSANVANAAMQVAEEILLRSALPPEAIAFLRDKVRLEAWLKSSGIDKMIERALVLAEKEREQEEQREKTAVTADESGAGSFKVFTQKPAFRTAA